MPAKPNPGQSKTNAGRRGPPIGSRCQICAHADRISIELAMARGASRRSVATKYEVSDDSVYRHWHHHVSQATKGTLLASYLKPGETIQAILDEETPGLLDRLQALRAGLWHSFNMAVELDDRVGLAPIARELRQIDELVASQTGELRARATAPVVHLHAAAENTRVRQAMMVALRPYPDALAAVVAALRSIDTAPPSLIEGRVA